MGAEQIPRFQCNFALKYPRSAGEIIRALRNSSRIYLVLNSDGLLEARVENTFALQQPTQRASSNAIQTFNGGWPAYEFDEASIARNSDGSASLRITTKGAQDTPNRLTVEFQDEFNQYQQDSLSVSDGDDSDLCGQIITASLDAMGISNFSQASRMLLLGLNRGIEGNRFVEFETSVKALGLMPGDLITVTYPKENLLRAPFRVLKITPGTAFRTAVITAQTHNDAWYSDTVTSIIGGRGWQGSQGSGLPVPVGGTIADSQGRLQLGIAEKEVVASDGSVEVELNVSFTEPSGQQGVLPAPLVSLVAAVNTTGGTLAGGATYFYAISAVDSGGGESPLSFIVQASTGGGTTNSIILSGIGLTGTATGIHVYRGTTPQQLYRIASNQTPAVTFTDTGLGAEAVLPPDPQFDHVNLYWRWELSPEAAVTGHTSTTVGNTALVMPVNGYQGAVVRITRGAGAGQERRIVSNSGTILTVERTWTVEPDATSFFVVAENSWRKGNTGQSSPLTIDVPERIGTFVHVSARAANVAGEEASYDLSPLTRWELGASGGLAADFAVPPAPNFVIGVSPGSVNLQGIGFTSLLNTTSIIAGTYRIHYYDEVNGVAVSLSEAATATAGTMRLAAAVLTGTLLQIDQEIVLAGATDGDGNTTVTRGLLASVAADHLASTPAYLLKDTVIIVPFVRNFFGTPASGDWSTNVELADVRIASVELYMTNSLGDGVIQTNSYTSYGDLGLRSLAGGQYSFQISGYLAVQTGAAPDIIVDSARSVRDVYAVLRGPSSGAGVTLELKRTPTGGTATSWATVQFDPNTTTSYVVNGFGLPVLNAGDRLSLDVTGVGTTNPGGDLTLVIRL